MRIDLRTSATRVRWGIVLLAIAATSTVTLFAAGPLAARSGTLPTGNLVQNPGGEADRGAKDSNTTATPQGWTTTGTFTAVQYGAPDFLTTGLAAQIGGGSTFFAGGRNAPVSTATQTIDVTGAATEINAGGVQATLSAYLGGYATQRDAAIVDATFLSATGATLGTVRVGPVGPADRQSETTLVQRSATAEVPKSTTTIRVVMTSTRTDGTYNDGYLDNISLELNTTAPPPPSLAAGKPTLAVVCSGKTVLATVKPGVRSTVTSVTFLVDGKTVTVDRTAPFTARIKTPGHGPHRKVSAGVRAAGKLTVLAKAAPQC